jgi:hypothetical protein
LARAAKKNPPKNKYCPLKFFFHRCKLQAGSYKDDYQTESHFSRPINASPPHDRKSSGATKGADEAGEGGGHAPDLSGDLTLEMPACILEGWMEEELQWAKFLIIFLWIFVARANQKNPELGARPPEYISCVAPRAFRPLTRV